MNSIRCLAVWGWLVAPAVFALGHAGVCPDGSVFIVKKKVDAPCLRPKFVHESEIPPIRPELLPKPYSWYVDQEAKNPYNAYNLVDDAEKIRALREQQRTGVTPPTPVQPRSTLAETIAPTGRLSLEPAELNDLGLYIERIQRVVPAAFGSDRSESVTLQFAYSQAFEAHARDVFENDKAHYVVFMGRASGSAEFHPNFYVVQDSLTYRPDPNLAPESGILAGEAGALHSGDAVLGYFRVPGVFDFGQEIQLWWNDQRIEVVLAP